MTDFDDDWGDFGAFDGDDAKNDDADSNHHNENENDDNEQPIKVDTAQNSTNAAVADDDDGADNWGDFDGDDGHIAPDTPTVALQNDEQTQTQSSNAVSEQRADDENSEHAQKQQHMKTDGDEDWGAFADETAEQQAPPPTHDEASPQQPNESVDDAIDANDNRTPDTDAPLATNEPVLAVEDETKSDHVESEDSNANKLQCSANGDENADANENDNDTLPVDRHEEQREQEQLETEPPLQADVNQNDTSPPPAVEEAVVDTQDEDELVAPNVIDNAAGVAPSTVSDEPLDEDDEQTDEVVVDNGVDRQAEDVIQLVGPLQADASPPAQGPEPEEENEPAHAATPSPVSDEREQEQTPPPVAKAAEHNDDEDDGQSAEVVDDATTGEAVVDRSTQEEDVNQNDASPSAQEIHEHELVANVIVHERHATPGTVSDECEPDEEDAEHNEQKRDEDCDTIGNGIPSANISYVTGTPPATTTTTTQHTQHESKSNTDDTLHDEERSDDGVSSATGTPTEQQSDEQVQAVLVDAENIGMNEATNSEEEQQAIVDEVHTGAIHDALIRQDGQQPATVADIDEDSNTPAHEAKVDDEEQTAADADHDTVNKDNPSTGDDKDTDEVAKPEEATDDADSNSQHGNDDQPLAASPSIDEPMQKDGVPQDEQDSPSHEESSEQHEEQKHDDIVVADEEQTEQCAVPDSPSLEHALQNDGDLEEKAEIVPASEEEQDEADDGTASSKTGEDAAPQTENDNRDNGETDSTSVPATEQNDGGLEEKAEIVPAAEEEQDEADVDTASSKTEVDIDVDEEQPKASPKEADDADADDDEFGANWNDLDDDNDVGNAEEEEEANAAATVTGTLTVFDQNAVNAESVSELALSASGIDSPKAQVSHADSDLDLSVKETPLATDEKEADNVSVDNDEVQYLSEQEDVVSKYDDDLPTDVLVDDGNNKDVDAEEEEETIRNADEANSADDDGDADTQEQVTAAAPDGDADGDDWGDFDQTPADTHTKNEADAQDGDDDREEEQTNVQNGVEPEDNKPDADGNDADDDFGDDSWGDFDATATETQPPKTLDVDDGTENAATDAVESTENEAPAAADAQDGDFGGEDDWGDFDEPPPTADTETETAKPKEDENENETQNENENEQVNKDETSASAAQDDKPSADAAADDWGDHDDEWEQQQPQPQPVAEATTPPAPSLESLDDTVLHRILNVSADANEQFSALRKVLCSFGGVCSTIQEKYVCDERPLSYYSHQGDDDDQKTDSAALPEMAMPLSMKPSTIRDFVWDGSLIETKLFEAIQLPKPRPRGAKPKPIKDGKNNSKSKPTGHNTAHATKSDKNTQDKSGGNTSATATPTAKQKNDTSNAHADVFAIFGPMFNSASQDNRSQNVEDILPSLPATKTPPEPSAAAAKDTKTDFLFDLFGGDADKTSHNKGGKTNDELDKKLKAKIKLNAAREIKKIVMSLPDLSFLKQMQIV